MSHTRAQASIEFITTFLIFLLFTSTIFITYLNKYNEITIRRASMEAESVANMIATTVNTAMIEGSGFSILLVLPETTFFSDYDAFFSQNRVYVNLSSYNIMVSRPIMTLEVVGNLKNGNNILVNRAGVIYIE